jgi:hypothetical protein
VYRNSRQGASVDAVGVAAGKLANDVRQRLKQLEQAVKLENEEFAVRVRSDEAREVFKAFFAKRRPASAA